MRNFPFFLGNFRRQATKGPTAGPIELMMLALANPNFAQLRTGALTKEAKNYNAQRSNC